MTAPSDHEVEDRLRQVLRAWADEAPLRPEIGDIGAPRRGGRRPIVWLIAAAAAAVVVAGAVVLAEGDDESVRVVDTDPTTTVERITMGGVGVRSLALRDDGVLVASSLDERLYEIDPATSTVVHDVAIPSHVEGVEAVDEGDVLLSRYDPDEVLRVDVETGEVLAEASFTSQPAMEFAFDAVWVADDAGDGGRLQRLDPETLEVTRTFPLALAPGFLAADADALWLGAAGEPAILRVDPETGDVTEVDGIAELGGAARAIQVGPDGIIWASVGDSVVRIDPNRAVVTGVVPVGRRPHGLAVDDEHVWVTSFDDGNVARIDTGSEPLRATTFVAGLRPGGVVAGFDSVWISLHQEATVLRVGSRASLPRAAAVELSETVDTPGGPVLVRCSGSPTPGRPTIVLEPDLRLGVAVWGPVEATLAADGRTCVVESTGDEPTDSPRLLGDQAADHVQALAAAGVPGPYLVVAANDAAITAQLLAHRFPGDVAGVVLIQPLPLDWFDRVRPLLDDEATAELDELVANDPVHSVVAASMDELAGFDGFADLPLTVIVPDPEHTVAEPGDEAAVDLLGRLQRDLAQSSTSGELVVARGSGTAIVREQPAAVVDAVDGVIARIEAR